MSFTDDMKKMLGSYEGISRDGQKKSNPVKEDSHEISKSDMDKMLNSYEREPRKEQKKEDSDKEKAEGISGKIKAIQDMRRVLYFIEKKVRGTLTEEDKQEVKDRMEQWENSMEILYQYAEEK